MEKFLNDDTSHDDISKKCPKKGAGKNCPEIVSRKFPIDPPDKESALCE